MKVGIPKEIKNNENRVGMTPAGVAELTRRGHEVSVQHTAGEGSGFSDDDYVKAGARILPTIEAVYRENDMIVKVKEPVEPEYAGTHRIPVNRTSRTARHIQKFLHITAGG